MQYRLRCGMRHLAVSAGLLSLLFLVLYCGWYRWPAWYLMGLDRVIWVLAVVDVGLGPLATLIVCSPLKPKVELRRDVCMIVLLQLLALCYGLHVLWEQRPVFYAFSTDRVTVVPAAAVDEEGVGANAIASFGAAWSRLPTWVWAPLPENERERMRIVTQAVESGKDVTSMLRYYRPFKQAKSELRMKLLPFGVLREVQTVNVDKLLREHGWTSMGEAALGILMIEGKDRDGTLVFRRDGSELLGFLPIEITSLYTKY